MQVVDNYHLRGVNLHKNTLTMHDLEANFEKILPIIKETLLDQSYEAPFAFLIGPSPH